jgi:hypothetical protein
LHLHSSAINVEVYLLLAAGVNDEPVVTELTEGSAAEAAGVSSSASKCSGPSTAHQAANAHATRHRPVTQRVAVDQLLMFLSQQQLLHLSIGSFLLRLSD